MALGSQGLLGSIIVSCWSASYSRSTEQWSTRSRHLQDGAHRSRNFRRLRHILCPGWPAAAFQRVMSMCVLIHSLHTSLHLRKLSWLLPQQASLLPVPLQAEMGAHGWWASARYKVGSGAWRLPLSKCCPIEKGISPQHPRFGPSC